MPLAASVVVAFSLAPGESGAQQLPTLKWAATRKAARRSSRRTRSDPSECAASTSRSPSSSRGRSAARREFVQVAFASLDQSAARGDFDIGLSGIEDTPARRAPLAVTIPYYEFREVLTVRAADATRFRTLADLRAGASARSAARSPTSCCSPRSASTASSPSRTTTTCIRTAISLTAASTPCCSTTCSPSAAMRRMPGLVDAAGRGRGRPLRRHPRRRPDAALRDRDRRDPARRDARRQARGDLRSVERLERRPAAALRAAAESRAEATSGGRRSLADGAARRAVAWDDDAAVLCRRCCGVARHARPLVPVDGARGRRSASRIAIGRVYGERVARALLTAYVEVMRGTPVLLQLFVIYYGLASVVRLPAFVAALLGLGLNYAAYESEIYRGALEAVPRGQLEAARTLGFTRVADPAARARAAGVPARARADDERLRRAAEGLVARLGAHRRRAHEADADLRDEPRQLGDSRARSARRSISRCRCRSRASRGGSRRAGRRRRAS